MSIYRDVNIQITGQVPDDYNDRNYEMLIAKLKIICVEYGLVIEDNNKHHEL